MIHFPFFLCSATSDIASPPTPTAMQSPYRQAGPIVRVSATQEVDNRTVVIAFRELGVIGDGSFGVVSKIQLVPVGSVFACKRVLQDRRYKVGQALTWRHMAKESHQKSGRSHTLTYSLSYFFPSLLIFLLLPLSLHS